MRRSSRQWVCYCSYGSGNQSSEMTIDFMKSINLNIFIHLKIWETKAHHPRNIELLFSRLFMCEGGELKRNVLIKKYI